VTADHPYIEQIRQELLLALEQQGVHSHRIARRNSFWHRWVLGEDEYEYVSVPCQYALQDPRPTKIRSEHLINGFRVVAWRQWRCTTERIWIRC